jgi:hypothetical protein
MSGLAVEVRTANLGNAAHNVTRRAQQRRLTMLTAGLPHAVALQELVPGLKAPRGYRLTRQGEEGILTPLRLKLRGEGYVIAHNGKAHHWPHRPAVWATVELGDQLVSFVSTHLNSHIDRAGRPWNLASEGTGLALDHLEKVRELAAWLATLGPTFVSGDWNVDAEDDARVLDRRFPIQQLGKAGLVDAWLAPAADDVRATTLGRRNVDRTFGPERARVLELRVRSRVDGWDHRALSTTWRLP